MNTPWTKCILLWKIVQRDYTRRLAVDIGLGGTFSRKIVVENQVLVAAATHEVSAFLQQNSRNVENATGIHFWKYFPAEWNLYVYLKDNNVAPDSTI